MIANAFCFDEAARVYGVNPDLLRVIAKIESNNKVSAVNHNQNGSTDFGVMQINSSWIKPLGIDQQELLRDPCYNVMTPARILKKCVDKHGYTWEAIGCYNAVNHTARVNYSWKIFSELNRGYVHNPQTTKGSYSNGSSLHFAVREKGEEGQ